MCNRARFAGEPDTLFERFGANWAQDVVRPNKDPQELYPDEKAFVIREERAGRVVDVMLWDVLGGATKWSMTNVRNLDLPQWRRLAGKPENRCLIPLTAFCEWTPDRHQVGKGKPIKGEMWFSVPEQPVFAVAGFWQHTAKGQGFTMVTCDPNELVAPIHPKAMITILHEADWDKWLRGSYEDVVASNGRIRLTRWRYEDPSSRHARQQRRLTRWRPSPRRSYSGSRPPSPQMPTSNSSLYGV